MTFCFLQGKTCAPEKLMYLRGFALLSASDRYRARNCPGLLLTSDKSGRKRNIGNFFLEIFLKSTITARSARFSKFEVRNVILF